MKIVIILTLFILNVQAQNSEFLFSTADSLLKIKEYKHSAEKYLEGIKNEGSKTDLRRFRSALLASVKSGEMEQTFQILKTLSTSDKITKFELYNLENSLDYNGFRSNPKWNSILDEIRKQAALNSYAQEELIYGRKDGLALTMIKISPKVKSNGKAIISVVSGNWFSGYNGIELSTTSMEQYLNKGYTVFGVVHGANTRYAIPDIISDIKRAVRFIRYNALKFAIDADNIGITGGSSGGHLSLAVAMSNDSIQTQAIDPIDRVSSRVQAAAVYYPPTDLLNWGTTGQNLVNANQLLKMRKVWGPFNFKVWNDGLGYYEEVTDENERSQIGKESSPIYFVTPDDPPILILHGTADPTVPIQQSKTFVEKLKEAGIPHNLIIKEGAKHNPNDFKEESPEMSKWFDTYLLKSKTK